MRSFNPRTHTGCDSRNSTCPRRPSSFNPRTHTGCDVRKGVTPIPNSTPRFNPRTHTGCDTSGCGYRIEEPTGWFQSTHPHGVRLTPHSNNADIIMFQSTHPHGVRLPLAVIFIPLWSFNPRTHTGCDDLLSFSLSSQAMFQSTHPHGVRLILLSCHSCHSVFQSTHPHGVRPNSWDTPITPRCFNPRTHTGCDYVCL